MFSSSVPYRDEWRELGKFPALAVSPDGLIKRASYVDERGLVRAERLLKPSVSPSRSGRRWPTFKGPRVRYTDADKTHYIFVAEAVAEAHLGLTDLDHFTVRHKDGNYSNNHVANLEIIPRYQPHFDRLAEKIALLHSSQKQK